MRPCSSREFFISNFNSLSTVARLFTHCRFRLILALRIDIFQPTPEKKIHDMAQTRFRFVNYGTLNSESSACDVVYHRLRSQSAETIRNSYFVFKRHECVSIVVAKAIRKDENKKKIKFAYGMAWMAVVTRIVWSSSSSTHALSTGNDAWCMRRRWRWPWPRPPSNVCVCVWERRFFQSFRLQWNFVFKIFFGRQSERKFISIFIKFLALVFFLRAAATAAAALSPAAR